MSAGGAEPDEPSPRAPLARTVRRVAVAAAGGTLLAAGMVMLVLPGPGLLVVPAALGVLGLEFEAPRRGRDALVARLRRLRARRRTGARPKRSEP
ncbi:MAG: PGPGW domain-containing protein [Myxococcota bacterium]|nr:PGPGW domain-containing protein [Myxococcota bacterium]